MKYSRIIVVFLFLISLSCQSQNVLRVIKSRFGAGREYRVYTGDVLTYKLKGDFFYKKDRIIAMQDSNIMLETRGEIKLKELKKLRLNKDIHLVGTVQFVVFGGAVAVVTLNTINNAMIGTSPVFDPKAAYISMGILAAGFLIRELNFVRIKVNRYKDLKILELDYQHLNTDSTSVSR